MLLTARHTLLRAASRIRSNRFSNRLSLLKAGARLAMATAAAPEGAYCFDLANRFLESLEDSATDEGPVVPVIPCSTVGPFPTFLWLLYAVPSHPLSAAHSVHLPLHQAALEGVVNGLSAASASWVRGPAKFKAKAGELLPLPDAKVCIM